MKILLKLTPIFLFFTLLACNVEYDDNPPRCFKQVKRQIIINNAGYKISIAYEYNKRGQLVKETSYMHPSDGRDSFPYNGKELTYDKNKNITTLQLKYADLDEGRYEFSYEDKRLKSYNYLRFQGSALFVYSIKHNEETGIMEILIYKDDAMSNDNLIAKYVRTYTEGLPTNLSFYERTRYVGTDIDTMILKYHCEIEYSNLKNPFYHTNYHSPIDDNYDAKYFPSKVTYIGEDNATEIKKTVSTFSNLSSKGYPKKVTKITEDVNGEITSSQHIFCYK